MPGENLDLSSEPPRPAPHPARRPAPADPPSRAGRPFLGVRFNCCGEYARIYRNEQATAYQGRCPRCGKPAEFTIGPGGSGARFFEVS